MSDIGDLLNVVKISGLDAHAARELLASANPDALKSTLRQIGLAAERLPSDSATLARLLVAAVAPELPGTEPLCSTATSEVIESENRPIEIAQYAKVERLAGQPYTVIYA